MIENPAILYVEDDLFSREVMELLLVEMLGYSQLTVFEDSTNFMTRLQKLERKPDIIFLDIHMVPHNGFEMLKMLRDHEAYQNVPVVALTASVMNEEVQLLQSAGFNSCISKPIDQRAFPDIMARILKGEKLWRIK